MLSLQKLDEVVKVAKQAGELARDFLVCSRITLRASSHLQRCLPAWATTAWATTLH